MELMHWTGALLALLGCAWLGFEGARSLEKRVQALGEMIAGLELLRRELWERGTPLPELMEDLAGRCAGPARALFAGCARACAGLDEVPFWRSWETLVAQQILLGPGGREALRPLGQVLGRYEADSQRQAVEQAAQLLEGELERAREESRRLGRVYRCLGAAGGGFLVILLL